MYKMKRYTVGRVRESFAEALDAVDQGVPVVIERRGVLYRLTREAGERKYPTGRRRKPIFTRVDPALLDGQWSWSWSPERVTFKARRVT